MSAVKLIPEIIVCVYGCNYDGFYMELQLLLLQLHHLPIYVTKHTSIQNFHSCDYEYLHRPKSLNDFEWEHFDLAKMSKKTHTTKPENI